MVSTSNIVFSLAPIEAFVEAPQTCIIEYSRDKSLRATAESGKQLLNNL